PGRRRTASRLQIRSRPYSFSARFGDGRPVPGGFGPFAGSLASLGAVRLPHRHAASGHHEGPAVRFPDLFRVYFRQPPQLSQPARVVGIDLGGGLGLVVEDNRFLFIQTQFHLPPPFCRSNSSLKLTYWPVSSSTTVAS